MALFYLIFRDIQISVSLPKFIISYWASFSSDRGVRVIGHQMQLSSSHRMGVAPKRKTADQLSRRPQASYRMNYMNAELIDAEVYLYKNNPLNAVSKRLQYFFIFLPPTPLFFVFYRKKRWILLNLSLWAWKSNFKKSLTVLSRLAWKINSRLFRYLKIGFFRLSYCREANFENSSVNLVNTVSLFAFYWSLISPKFWVTGSKILFYRLINFGKSIADVSKMQNYLLCCISITSAHFF